MIKYVIEVKDFDGRWIRDYEPNPNEYAFENEFASARAAMAIAKTFRHETRVLKVEESIL